MSFTSLCRDFIIYRHKKRAVTVQDILRNRDNTHSFIIVYCYNRSILLLAIVIHLLLCLIYKLNFIEGMYVWEKQSYI